MAYVWGQGGTDQTPLFARWVGNVLSALYENKLTLIEAEHLVDRVAKQVRRAMTADLKDKPSRQDWQFADTLNAKDFEAQIGSTVNRLQRFIRNQTLRSMFGQPDASLDLGRALEEGSIVLVSLATERAKVSKENAELFATLLLSDLWTAAQERGKRDGVKPFYVYLDEFQRFVTPTISDNLDEARGFGLHLTMAHQFPNQLLDRGENGKRVYNSIMENASSKVVFRLADSSRQLSDDCTERSRQDAGHGRAIANTGNVQSVTG
jgi:type IV secretory pathway TraG/TraD family ATPase VirD4